MVCHRTPTRNVQMWPIPITKQPEPHVPPVQAKTLCQGIFFLRTRLHLMSLPGSQQAAPHTGARLPTLHSTPRRPATPHQPTQSHTHPRVGRHPLDEHPASLLLHPDLLLRPQPRLAHPGAKVAALRSGVAGIKRRAAGGACEGLCGNIPCYIMFYILPTYPPTRTPTHPPTPTVM